MRRLPVLPAREIIKALGKAGFIAVSQRGSHVKLRGQGDGEERTVVVRNYQEVPRGVLVSILRRAGLSRGGIPGVALSLPGFRDSALPGDAVLLLDRLLEDPRGVVVRSYRTLTTAAPPGGSRSHFLWGLVLPLQLPTLRESPGGATGSGGLTVFPTARLSPSGRATRRAGPPSSSQRMPPGNPFTAIPLLQGDLTCSGLVALP